jgi:hypothetical protein
LSRSPETVADESFFEALREHARWQQPCERFEGEGLLAITGPNSRSLAFRNSAIRLDPRLDPAAFVDRAASVFAPRGRDCTLLLRAAHDEDVAELLRARGLEPGAEAPCMLIERPLVPPQDQEGLRVERFVNEAQVLQALGVLEDAYAQLGLPPEETRLFFEDPERLLSPRVVGFLASIDAEPAAVALTLLDGEGAGVYWVGTASRAQRRGLADSCTRLATNAGFEAGARVVTLQASPLGEPLYRKLGYRTYDRLQRFRLRAPS